MGYALARAASDAGATVVLISGPTALVVPDRVEYIEVCSAEEMYRACLARLTDCDIFIASAAVSDYRPIRLAEQKIKKNQGDRDMLTIELERTPDIVAAVAAHHNRPFVVGFAAETQQLIHYARHKLQQKKLDMIIANDVSNPEVGFNSDDNQVVLLTQDREVHLPKSSKAQLAREIIEYIANNLDA
jgi:phosphopantothenoylcysteine decarboxylase/phosphopantothenate--cysteine ligase